MYFGNIDDIQEHQRSDDLGTKMTLRLLRCLTDEFELV